MRTSVIGIVAACVLTAGSVFASEELAEGYNCMGCHSAKAGTPSAKKYGPTFAEIATKYKEKGEKAPLILENSILNGSRHKWDRPIHMMPRSEYGKGIDLADASKVADWIMSLAAEPAVAESPETESLVAELPAE